MNPKDLSLYAQEIQSLLEVSCGELTPEIEEKMKAIDLNNREEIDRIYFGLEMIEAHVAHSKELANKFREHANCLQNYADRQRYWIKELMKMTDKRDLHGENIRLKLSNGANKVVYSGAKVPMEYFKEVKETVLDKERVKSDLEMGVPVEGAVLEPVYTLRSYMVTKKEMLEKK